MRILFISQYFYPENFNNNKIVTLLVERGHQVEVLTGIPNYPAGKFFDGYGLLSKRTDVYNGAKIRRVPIVPRGRRSITLLANYASYMISASLRGLFYRRGQFDVILSSAPSPATIAVPGIFAAKRMGIPHAFLIQDLWPQTPIAILKLKNPTLVRMLTAFCRWIYNRIDVMVVPSRAFVPEIDAVAPGRRYYYFPNTIEAFHQPQPMDRSLRRELGFSDDDFVLGFAGNIGEAQNIDAIVDAVKLAARPEIKLLMLGDGRHRAALEARIAKLGLQSHFNFIGSVPSDQVPRYLSVADSAILTLAADAAFVGVIPFRLQTFLGCGKPILGHVGGESARIIKEADCGLVSDPSDAKALADNMIRMASMQGSQLAGLGAASRSYALREFSEKPVFDGLENLLSSMQEVPNSPASTFAAVPIVEKNPG
jgi:colanic acid biosynthesis glycosyl transferase WcaI